MGEAIGSMEELVENINNFFVNLSSDFQSLEDDPSYQAECLADMLVDPYQAYHALMKFLIGYFETFLSICPPWSLTFMMAL